MKNLTLLIISVFLLSLFTVIAAPQPGLCYFGDSNGDCVITGVDATQAKLSSLLKAADYSSITPYGLDSSVQDVNGDGVVTISDYNLIKGMVSLKSNGLTGVPTTITATRAPTQMDWNAVSTITVKVTDADGTPRAGIGVSFTIDKDLSTVDATLTGRDPSNGDNAKTTSLPYIADDSIFELTNTISQGGEATININTNSLVDGEVVIKTFIQGNLVKGGDDINGEDIIIKVENGAVTTTNSAPVFDPINLNVNGAVYSNQLIQFTVSATDSDFGDVLTYNLVSGPGSFDPSTQTYTWTPVQADKTGFSTLYTLLFSVTDAKATTKTSANIILINRIPVIQDIANVTIDENGLVSVNPVVTDEDGDDFTVTYSAPLDSNGKWQTDYNSAGMYTITVIATDGINPASKTFNINVNDISQNNDNQGNNNQGGNSGGHNYEPKECILTPTGKTEIKGDVKIVYVEDSCTGEVTSYEENLPKPKVTTIIPVETENNAEQNINAQGNQATGFSVVNLAKQNPVTTAIAFVSVILLSLLGYGVYWFKK